MSTADFNGRVLLDLRKIFPLSAVAICVTACASPQSATSQPSSSAAQADYESACAAVAPDDRLSCPLLLWARSVDDVDGGVVMHLGPEAPPPEQTATRARCHRAWMARYGRSMSGPLSAKGPITIAASPGTAGTDVTITASDPVEIEDVRVRTHTSFDEHHPKVEPKHDESHD